METEGSIAPEDQEECDDSIQEILKKIKNVDRKTFLIVFDILKNLDLSNLFSNELLFNGSESLKKYLKGNVAYGVSFFKEGLNRNISTETSATILSLIKTVLPFEEQMLLNILEKYITYINSTAEKIRKGITEEEENLIKTRCLTNEKVLDILKNKNIQLVYEDWKNKTKSPFASFLSLIEPEKLHFAFTKTTLVEEFILLKYHKMRCIK
ncbi:hypothetical protein [Alphaproteobacteria bacterium endosymbiont of Tiliacea citrago]|uniref:hypothetical protein n=1 Tax=Alphaproteobacteria bacterium endosymbiont of Tiliacea citrago TaxID=3077944 RepID=UPI00313BC7E7